MILHDAIGNHLSTWLPLVDLVGDRIDFDEIPGRTPVMGRVVLRRISSVGAHPYGIRNRPKWWADRFQFEGWAESRAEAEAIGQATIDAMHDGSGQRIGGVPETESTPEQVGIRIRAVQVVGDFDAVARDLSPKKFVRIVDVKFQYLQEG